MAEQTEEQIEKCASDFNDLNRNKTVGLLFNRLISELDNFVKNLNPTLAKVRDIYLFQFPSDDEAKGFFTDPVYISVPPGVADDYTSLSTFIARRDVIKANYNKFLSIESKLSNLTDLSDDDSLTIQNYRDLSKKFEEQNLNLSEYDPQFFEIYNRCSPSEDSDWEEKRAKELAQEEIDRLGDEEITDEEREQIEKEAREKAAAEAEKNGKRGALSVVSTLISGGAINTEEFGARYLEKTTWSPSCFLLNLASQFAVYKQSISSERQLPYDGTDQNSSLLIDGDPFSFLNKLTQYPSTHAFFNITNHEIASLQPKIRLFKIVSSKELAEDGRALEEEIEFNFDSHATNNDIQSLLKDKNKRGFGAGIKSFSYELKGSNPFSVKKDILASLEIYASSFDELLKDRGGYSYIDFALKTGDPRKPPAEEDSDSDLKKLNFRLKAIVGWSYPIGNAKVLRSSELKNAIYNSYATLNLTPVTHTFNINTDGSVVFKIDYFAFIQDFFEQPAFNIFTDPDIISQSLVRKSRIKALNKKCSTEEINKVKEAEKTRIQGEKKALIKSLISSLYDNNKVFHVTIKPEDLERAIDEGPYFDLSTLGAGAISTPDSAASDTSATVESSVETEFEEAENPSDDTPDVSAVKNSLMTRLTDSDPNNNTVKVVFVSDLFDSILTNIGNNLDTVVQSLKNELGSLEDEIEQDELNKEIDKLERFSFNFAQFRLLLGPIELTTYEEGNRLKHISLGDLPISLDEFLSWLTNKVLGTDKVVYSLTTFANDFFNNYLKSYVRNPKCYAYSTKQKVILNQNIITSYRDVNTEEDQLTKKIKQLGLPGRLSLDNSAITSILPLLHPAGNPGDPRSNPGFQNQINYLVFSAGRVTPSERLVGDESYDKEIGIFHYYLGKNSGIVKNITLEKASSNGLKELRFEQEGYDGLTQLREIYNVKIDTIAYPNIYPGTYIYVDPKGFSPNSLSSLYGDGKSFNLTKFGVGGYCMVIGATHSFASGEASTSITAKWVAGTTTYLDVESEADSGSSTTTGDGTPTCDIKEDLL